MEDGWEKREGTKQPEGAKCPGFQNEKDPALASELNATQQHSGIIKQMVCELATKNMLVPE